MSDQGRQQQHWEAQVAEAVEKLEFMESQGLHPQVTSPDGKIAGFIDGPVTSGSSDRSHFDDAIRTYNDLHRMHKDDRERGILIEAWKRFHES